VLFRYLPRMPEDVAIDVIARLETSDCEVA
jgi:hypothetical protein